MIPFVICIPCTNPSRFWEINRGRCFCNLPAVILVMILYTMLHKLIGLKSLKSLAPLTFGIRAKKVAFQDFEIVSFSSNSSQQLLHPPRQCLNMIGRTQHGIHQVQKPCLCSSRKLPLWSPLCLLKGVWSALYSFQEANEGICFNNFVIPYSSTIRSRESNFDKRSPLSLSFLPAHWLFLH